MSKNAREQSLSRVRVTKNHPWYNRRLARTGIAVLALGILVAVGMVYFSDHQGGVALAGGKDEDRPQRVRVETEEGTLLLFDAAQSLESQGDAAPLLAYWYDKRTRQLFVFPDLITQGSEVAPILASLEQNLGVDLDPILRAYAPFANAIAGFDEPHASTALPEPSPTAITAPFCDPNQCLAGTASLVPPGLDKRVILSFPPGPRTSDSGDALEDSTAQAVFCNPCPGGGGGGGGGGDPCSDVVCDDQNPCTSDSCSNNGTCVFVPIADACCDGSMATALSTMQQGLASFVDAEGLPANLEIGEPSTNESGAEVFLQVFGPDDRVRRGTSSVTCATGLNSVSVLMEFTDAGLSSAPSRIWTLTLNLWEEGDVLHIDGTMDLLDFSIGSFTFNGGWTFSQSTGPLLDPTSDPGFHDEVANMFNIVSPTGATAEAGGSLDIGTILAEIVNITQMIINYFLDLFIPYTPPTSCTGPSIDDGTGGSCENVDIPCAENLIDMCMMVGDIPEASVAFKKCMKGRCGCGGSNHRRLHITCDSSSDCGPCGNRGIGCSLYGSRIWYCNGSPDLCSCVDTIFHEMSHGCGANDIPRGTTCPPPGGAPKACRIGHWFAEQLDALPDVTCDPPR